MDNIDMKLGDWKCLECGFFLYSLGIGLNNVVFF